MWQYHQEFWVKLHIHFKSCNKTLRKFSLSSGFSLLLGLWCLLDDTHGNSLSVVSLGFLVSGLDSSGLSLLLELGLSNLLLLHLVDGFNQDGLVLVLVTLGTEIEVMVDILGDLLGFSILLEESSKNSLSSHPEDLGWHSGVSGTLSLTETVVSSYKIKINSLITKVISRLKLCVILPIFKFCTYPFSWPPSFSCI
jgi:hypothetical protein